MVCVSSAGASETSIESLGARGPRRFHSCVFAWDITATTGLQRVYAGHHGHCAPGARSSGMRWAMSSGLFEALIDFVGKKVEGSGGQRQEELRR